MVTEETPTAAEHSTLLRRRIGRPLVYSLLIKIGLLLFIYFAAFSPRHRPPAGAEHVYQQLRAAPEAAPAPASRSRGDSAASREFPESPHD